METTTATLPFYRKYERHILTLVFLGGFIIDNFTLTRVDRLFDNLILSGYLFLAALSIYLWNSSFPFVQKFESIYKTLPAVTQFSFGALFSGFVVFYSRSGLLVAHLPFLLLLVCLFIGNERIHKRYQELTFQVSIFFVSSYLYSLFVLPVILKQIGVLIFILGGIISLALTLGLVWCIHRAAYDLVEKSRKTLSISIATIYCLINFFYFAHLIPPLPLSIKDIGVYHSVVRKGNTYEVIAEKKPWTTFFRLSIPFHKRAGEPVYVFSSVFAPTELSTTIIHEWSYFDLTKRDWISSGRSDFTIVGGRDGGYRGYSFRENLSAGLWRVDVLTPRNEIIGRIRFEIIDNGTWPEMITEIR